MCEGVDNHARALVRGLAGERAMIAERRHRSLGLRIGVAQRRGADQRLHHRPVYDPDASRLAASGDGRAFDVRSEEHTSELQSLMRISYAVFCLKKKKNYDNNIQ